MGLGKFIKDGGLLVLQADTIQTNMVENLTALMTCMKIQKRLSGSQKTLGTLFKTVKNLPSTIQIFLED